MSSHTLIPELQSLLLATEEIAKMTMPNTPRFDLAKGPQLIPSESNKIRSAGSVPYTDIEGVKIDNRIHFRCRVNCFNRLTYNKVAVSAKSLAYYFSGIQWRAGAGWPVYSERCPRLDTDPRNPFPPFHRHSLIVLFGGIAWGSCSNSDAGVGNQITDVFVGPNDDQLADNIGVFDFIISCIGQ